MLPEQCHELLSVYLDGELSTRQRKAVLRLLRRSSEARALLRQMQEASRRLRQLPRKPSDPEFEVRLLQAFAEQQAQPARFRPPAPEPATIPLWLGLAVAAAVLVTVSAGSYIYFGDPFRPGQAPAPFAVNEPPLAPAPGNGPGLGPDPAPEQVALPREEPPVPAGPLLPDPSRAAPVEPLVRAPRPAPVEPSRDPEVLAAPAPVKKRELFPSDADLKVSNLPVLFKLHELDEDKTRERLHVELKKASAYRLELPCQGSSARAFQRVQSVVEKAGIRLVVDQVAQVRLKSPQLKTNYVIYLEDVTLDELARILQQLGIEDRKAAPPRREFTMLVTTPMTDADRKVLSQLLGVDARQLSPPRSTSPLGMDLRRPLSDTTAGEVLLAMAGQGKAPRPEPGKPPAVKPARRLALALAYNPVRPTPGSPEVKRFLDSRRQPREGTLQVLLVLRDPD